MTVKELLNEILRLELKMERTAMKRDSLRTLAESVTTVIRGTNVSGSHNDRKLEELLNESAELDREFLAMALKLADLQKIFFSCLETLDNPVAEQILILRALDKKSFPEIAEEMQYSESHVKLLCKKSWLKLQDKKVNTE